MHGAIHPLVQNTAASTRLPRSSLDVAHALFQFLQFLLEVGMFLGHVLVLVLPFIASLLQCLNLALEVAGLDVGLSESEGNALVRLSPMVRAVLLLIGFSQRLVSLFGFLLEHLEFSL